MIRHLSGIATTAAAGLVPPVGVAADGAAVFGAVAFGPTAFMFCSERARGDMPDRGAAELLGAQALNSAIIEIVEQSRVDLVADI